MSAAKMCTNPCDTCEKKGLPLLLTRYAIFSKEADAPALSGKLNDKILAEIPLGAEAAYGLRLLRSGYVYVYDARGYWEEYFVTLDGFLSKLPVRSKAVKVSPAPRTEFACARSGAAPLAGVITIRNPANAKAVWVGFSDVEWTDATLAQHDDKNYRDKHMTKILLTKGKVGTQARTAKIQTIDKVVPEFILQPANINKSITPTTSFQFNSRIAHTSDFKKAIKEIDPAGGGAIVALLDPVSVAMEIAALMELRKVTFMSEESVAKPRFAASTIASLESAIKEQAKLAEIMSADELADQMIMDGGAANLLDSYRKRVEKVREVTPAQLQKAADKQWHGYTHDSKEKQRFDTASSRSWLKTYNDGFKDFDAKSIAPLAKAHATWMAHQCLSDHLSCNYDDCCKESGVAFTSTVVELLRYTTDKQPSYDLYLSWLKKGEFAAENLVMRAMAFNQKDLIAKLETADAAPVDSRAFPTDAVAGAVAAFMEKMPASANAQLTALLAGLSGPALKYWDDFNAGRIGTKAAAAMAAVSGKQFVRLPINGNRGQFIQAYVEQLYSLDPDLKTHPNQLQKAIASQVRLLEIEGVKTQAKSKLGWYVLLDREVVAGAVSKNLSGQALADELAKAVRTPQDLKRIDLARAMKFQNGMTAGATVLGGVLMLWNFTKLLDDVGNSMSHERPEAITKLIAGGIAIGGFVAEQVGNKLDKLGEVRLRNMLGRVGVAAPRFLQVAGRFAGFGVGVFLGLWDMFKGWESYKAGDTGLTRAYFISGVAGMAIATTMLLVGMGSIALGPIGWIILAIGMLIWLGATLFIETNKDNKLQEWLSRCHFGFGVDKYPDAATHIKQYKLALAE